MNSSQKEDRARVRKWGLKTPRSIFVLESLDGRRRANAKRKDEARGLGDYIWRKSLNNAHRERGGPELRGAENSGMRHGAN
jgi:hypothetical protein